MTNDELQAHLISGDMIKGRGYSMREKAKRLVCADGFSPSIQASETHYSEPRDNDGPYEAVEIGYPSAKDDGLLPYAEDDERPTDTVYGWVPAGVVLACINRHGGVKT